MVEKSRRWSPFNYVQNNPIRLTDPDGMLSDEEWQETQVLQSYVTAMGESLNGPPGSHDKPDNPTVTNYSSDKNDNSSHENTQNPDYIWYTGEEALWIANSIKSQHYYSQLLYHIIKGFEIASK